MSDSEPAVAGEGWSGGSAVQSVASGHAHTAGDDLHNTDPGGELELLQSKGGAWEVSRASVIRIAWRVRPREVDEALAMPVRTDGQPLSIGRAIFIVPRLALNGELHGVVGGGVPAGLPART